MAEMNTRFYRESDDALYSDGDIENVIYERVCNNDTTLSDDPDWAVFYHFSPIRQNILNWYPFRKDGTILEIGAGCGALTGMLAQRAAHVTACELTMNRARILYQRHKSLDNLEVCVGNFLKAEFDRKFDYIVINGVLEYARGIMGDQYQNPFVAFLKHAQSYLKPDGIILLSIENRLGLKYLAGAPEDHVGKAFAGVNGYKNGEHVQTFSKSELEELFDWTGLSVHRWYYPYPDYKFPTEIFTDDSVNSRKPVTLDIPMDMRRANLFDKEAVYETLMKDQIAGNFSNSFLVELSAQTQVREAEPTYIKISNNRKKNFAVCTVLYEHSKYVEKVALYPEGEKHLAGMAVKAAEDLPLRQISYDTGDPRKLRYDFVEEESLRQIILRQVESGETESFWDTIRSIYDCLRTGEPMLQEEDPQFMSVFGTEKITRPLHWVKNMNIDLNVDNVFFKSGRWLVIDNEWVFPFMIPAEYAMWRILSQLQLEKPFSGIMTGETVNRFLNITEAETETFRRWEIFFAEQYVGIRDLSPHYQPVVSLDIDDVLARHMRNNQLISHLFLFQENREWEVLECAAVNNDGIWSVVFRSDKIKDATWIRWDPLEGSACHISEVYADGFSVKAINADLEEPEYTFATFDPQFAITGDFSDCAQLEIRFRCQIRDWTTGYFKLELQKDHERKQRQWETAQKEQAVAERDKATKQLQENLQQLQQLQAQLNAQTEKNKMLEQQLEMQNQQLEMQNQQLEMHKQYLQTHKLKASLKVLCGKKFEI